MKGYYRQKKKTSTTKYKSKPSSASKKKSTKSDKSAVGSLDLQDDYDAKEKMLREFDMNRAYGPCIGMTRLERWQRAERLGLKPPKEVEDLLKSGEVRPECLWNALT